MRPGLAGFREPGFRFAGQVDSSGGGGGSSDAVDISITDAGGFYTSTNVEGALQEAFVAVNLRAKLADLASTAAGKGASLIGTNDPSLLILGLHPTVEASLVSIAADTDAAQTDATTALANAATANAGVATNTAAIAANTTAITANTSAIALRPLTTDLASTAAGKGGALIGLQDAGAFFATKNVEAALQQLGPAIASAGGAFTVALSSTLTDAGTTTAPDLFTIAHRSSGTPAANFGLTVARELDSSTKTRRRALAEVTKWTTATDGAETATHTFQLRTAAVLTDTLSLGATSNFPTSGSAAAPTLTVGTVGDLLGLYRSSSGELGFGASGTRLGRWSSSGLLSDTIFIGPLGTAGAPTFTVNGTTGGSGLYGITGGSGGLSLSVLNSDMLTALKAGNAFKFTALVPGANNTASTEFVGFDVAMGRTSTWGTGALTTQREMLIRKPTYAFGGASTITTTATLAIEGSPVAGSNATITNGYSLWTQAGTVRFDLADAATTTAPDGRVQRHTTSGTAAAGFGITNAIELQSGAGNVRRVMTDVVALTTATDGAEVATRTIATMNAGGAATNVMTLGFGTNFSGVNFPNAGSLSAPGLSLGTPSWQVGFTAGSNFSQWCLNAGAICQIQSDGLHVTGNVLATATTNPASPVFSFGTSSGMYYLLNGIGFSGNSVQLLGLTKTATPFVFLAPTPTTANNTASTEFVALDFNMSRTTNWATGALTTQREALIRKPTYSFVGASTITSAATLAIEGSPVAGSNATITNGYSFWVQAGAVRYDANFGFNKAPVAQQSTTGTNTGFTAGAGTAVNDQSTFTGGTGATAYRISDIVLALKNYGWLAA